MFRVMMKIGTLPQKVVFVGFKHNLPQRGDVVRVKEGTHPDDSRRPVPGARWRQVKIDDITHFGGGEILYRSYRL